MREEIKYILRALETKSTSVASFNEKLVEVLDDPLALTLFADEIKKELQSTKDISEDRIPFYDFYLAVAWNENNIGAAMKSLSKAVHDFRIRDFALNEALGEWLFSIFHYENQKYERAQRAYESAARILQQLITRCEEESKYEKARELKKHLSQLRNFQDSIKTPPASGDSKVESDTPDVSDLSEVPPDSQETSVKSKLQFFHEELTRIYGRLKEQQQRIPPTLVATIFFLYKTITPSHSVYSKVPPPETAREKEVYDDLIKKVGFFEVVEQLVELEREFEPAASREEILEIINHAWDQETRR